ncbi:PD-(D/E)XK nuclease family protein [bacterium]|nr:PD-(D/E)XK nuclease family protein [bacterium]
MNLFAEIEGRSNETLTTAVLRMLVLRSQELRDSFLALISRKASIRPIPSESFFSCSLEEPTDNERQGAGRIDLVLETDDAIVGIENKLFAAFQENQPGKYRATLTERAAELSKIRRREVRPLLAVLHPRSRQNEIDNLKGDLPGLVSVTWEDLVECFPHHDAPLDHTTQTILSEFRAFIGDRLAFLPDFAAWVPHLRRSWTPRGSEMQRELVARIWEFFPNGGTRMSIGESWAGYYFCETNGEKEGWYGFVDAFEVVQGTREAELIVATSFPVSIQSPALRTVDLKNEQFLGPGKKVFAWIIDFDDSWSSPDRWASKLRPFHRRAA